jgi:8-oxo-dGTP diphosphatase
MRLLLISAAALIDRHGRVLVQLRPPGAAMPGLWEFPGGKVEADETPEAALVRELREELGIEASIGDLEPLTFASAVVEDRRLVLLLYLCRKWAGEPRALHASELRWIARAGLRGLEMPPADLPFIPVLEAVVSSAPLGAPHLQPAPNR